MSNPLTDVVPGRWRRIGYAALFVIGTCISGAMVGFAAISHDIPDWLLFTAAFYGSVAGPAYAVPASNVSR